MHELREKKAMKFVKNASEYTTIQKPYAIVVGLDCVTGLQTARILARHKVPVIGIAKNPKHFCCRTRVCTEILFADTASDEFVNTLATLGLEWNQKAVLFPCTDMSVLLISRNRKGLEDRYHIVLPEPDVVEMLMDKANFYTYAAGQGLALPRTFFLHGRGDAESVIEKLTFPCVLKPPIKTPNWEKHANAKVFKISNPGELLSRYDRCSRWSEVLIVQEWVEGKDANLCGCTCYFNSDSKPIVTFVSRKLRQWPPEVGVSSLSEECRNDIVLQETIALFQNVRFRGLCYLEMKRDERTGKYFIIEPNIGRPIARSPMAESGGIEILYTMYCDAINSPLPANLDQKYEGIKWIYLRRDLQSALYHWRRGDITLKEWWRSLRGRKTYAVFSLSDPVPFLFDLKLWLTSLASKTFGLPTIVRRAASLCRHLLLICVGSVGHLMNRQVMSLIHKIYEKAPPRGPRSHIISKLKAPKKGSTRPMIVRFYKPGKWLFGLRHLYFKTIVGRNGISVPVTIGYGRLKLGGYSYFAVVEEYISGHHPEIWSEQLAFELGQQLGRWHDVSISRSNASILKILQWDPELYLKRANQGFNSLKGSHKALHSELFKSLQLLDNYDIRGDYAFSHGDLQHHNVVVNSDKRLIWLDFDQACRRPLRHDLAAVELMMLRKCPEVIDEFERGYFVTHSDQLDGWRKYRLMWYRIISLRRALFKLEQTRKLRGFKKVKEYMALNSACGEVKDAGQPSSELMRTIVHTAQHRLNS